MAALSFTPQIHQLTKPKPKLKAGWRYKPKATLSFQTPISSSTFSDPFVLQLAESLEDSIPHTSSQSPLQSLRDLSSQSLLSTPWPTRKDEDFRFTDTSLIRHSQIIPISTPPQQDHLLGISEDTHLTNLAIVDGFVVDSVSNVSNLPNGVLVGSLLGSSLDGITKRVCEFVGDFKWGDLFWAINGLGAPDVAVVYVPENCKVENPVHLRYFQVEGSEKGSNKFPVSNPRVIVVVEKGAEVEIVEEFVCKEGDDRSYWVNPVMEVVIGEGAKVRHSYVQRESLSSAHIKWTSVRQESASTYKLVEVSTGGKLSRHNLHVQQFGPDTVTELSTFHLSIGDQTQDLHSRLVFDHPRGYSRQLHKCIVAHSLGQAVFDGNVKVNRYAQQTDAGQLTRSLLLEPRATVNVKPNLQIIADDVKCSHGAAISDLEESQLFYFLARGIDLETAKRALVFSFGAEVMVELSDPRVHNLAKLHVKQMLERTPKG
ncbi:NON-INTRINSIC ABC protein 6 [Tripterygium wilfordii]|uniref:NON-INTRINSIC ABC protein 6 n=1 Tax=Tripterygium wilfordii TaxID=458696 RepID=A0A7J7C7E6_TRIWF|nr:protein ABCI7, chloroplastic-like [Tripterygium wilfordii]KAF5729686.1 NON-INTRINSIC ABC protein 6 [Tripterygium wilfordii]